MEAVGQPLLRVVVLVSGEVMVGNVGGEVHREPDPHDQDDHRDHVQVDPEVGHHPEDTDLHRDDGEDDPDDADLARDEQEDDDCHDGDAETDAAHRLIEHLRKLIEYVEEGVKQNDFEREACC